MMLMKVNDLCVTLGGLRILQNVNIELSEGEILAVVGANGAGKSTLLRTISGIVKPVSGTISYQGEDITKSPPQSIAQSGIALVPEGKQLFYQMTVVENLKIGGYKYRKDKARIQRGIEQVFDLFPVLGENKHRIAGTFSGGEQQMLSIGRGLMSEPKVLMIDELSLGLAPKIVDMLMKIIQKLNQQGMSIILVEQNVRHALRIAHRGYVFENGEMTMTATGEELLNDEHIRVAYIGM